VYTTLFFVVYDSIANSVFSGQVLAPLLNRLEKEPDLTAVLVSFEPSPVRRNSLMRFSVRMTA